MYRQYFNLQHNPFTTSPDPTYFYLAPSHAESVAKCSGEGVRVGVNVGGTWPSEYNGLSVMKRSSQLSL